MKTLTSELNIKYDIKVKKIKDLAFKNFNTIFVLVPKTSDPIHRFTDKNMTILEEMSGQLNPDGVYIVENYIINKTFTSVTSSNKEQTFKIDANGDREMDFELLTFDRSLGKGLDCPCKILNENLGTPHIYNTSV